MRTITLQLVLPVLLLHLLGVPVVAPAAGHHSCLYQNVDHDQNEYQDESPAGDRQVVDPFHPRAEDVDVALLLRPGKLGGSGLAHVPLQLVAPALLGLAAWLPGCLCPARLSKLLTDQIPTLLHCSPSLLLS